jgi:hypothetical protein
MEPSTPQTACFEAGIKFGSLYHQFAGTPVSPDSAASLETAIEAAIENQPHCESVAVDVLTADLAADLAERSADYAELTGRYLEVDVVVSYEGYTVRTSMAMEDDYPRMRIDEVSER